MNNKMEKYCDKFNNECREHNRNKYDRRCFICNMLEDVNAKRLSVHHVDCNKNQGCDNTKWKLIPLCASCHGKVHTEPLMSRINYLVTHEKDVFVTNYKQIYILQKECIVKKHDDATPPRINKLPTVREKILIALAAKMTHIDAIALHADKSEAHCRQICNQMADDGEITKICGRAHHSYYLKDK